MTESTHSSEEDSDGGLGFERPPAVQARGAITTHAEEFELSVGELVSRVTSIVEDANAEIVREELDRLERAGEVYLVGDGDEAEVRRT